MNDAPSRPVHDRLGESTEPVPFWVEMLVFDLLPAPIRDALNQTVMAVFPSDAMKALYQGIEPNRLAGIIRGVDKSHVAKTTILDMIPNVQPLERRHDVKNVSKSYRARRAVHGRRSFRL